MTKIVRLSSATAIERDEQGVAWIITTDHKVAAAWFNHRRFEEMHADGSWGHQATYIADADAYGDSAWRIHLSEAWRECYRYREGEPWALVVEVPEDTPKRLIMLRIMVSTVRPVRLPGLVHANAVQLCGYSPSSLRVLIQVVQGENIP